MERYRFNGVALVGIAGALFAGSAAAETVLSVDASKAGPFPEQGYFRMGDAKSPDGRSLGINSQFLTLNGHPWIPVMGELHYTRVPADDWENEILKMKSSGVNIIATYVIWMHHEQKPGVFDWSGDHDLHRFLELCAKHHMMVVLRPGPWAHGEVRYGGIPDWIVREMPSRRDDATYMDYVKRYWGEIAKQANGEYFKDGGPIVGIQLENEYNLIGPGMGASHIQALKTLAISLGMDTPLYTVTGWDGTTYPKGEVTPVFGGYPDEPWGLGTEKMPPNEVYNFRFNSRVAGNAGAQTPGVTKGTAIEDMPHTPFLGAEYAGGLPIMYRRRPLVSPDDIGAMLPVQLGSGVNLYGYYMFHGGRNPGLDLEENALLGGYNDLPVLNYDFQAPYGQYGEAHPVLNTIRPYLLFLNAFGDRLAPMAVHAPAKEPAGRDDLTTPRYSDRSEGSHGFVFMSNYVRQYPMADQKDVRFVVSLPGQRLTFPDKPVTIPSGAYFIWPFNFDLGGINLAWATAQPVTRIETAPGKTSFVFVAEDGIAPEFAVSETADLRISGPPVTGAPGLKILRPVPGQSNPIELHTKSATISLLVLTKAQARQLWVGDVQGRQRLVVSNRDMSFTGDTIALRSIGDREFRVSFYPALERKPEASLPFKLVPGKGAFQTFVGTAPERTISAKVTKIRDEGIAPPLQIGGSADRALQPYPEAFSKSAAWSISIPKGSLDGLKDAFLSIDYQGDVARLFSGTEMLDDQFFYGRTWTIGLKHFQNGLKQPLTLTVMPLRKDAPIYLDETVRSTLPPTDQVARVLSVKVLPVYSLEIK